MTNFVYTKKIIGSNVVFSYTTPEGDVWWFTEEPGNQYYEDYLKWLAEGNTPEVVDETD